MKTLLKIQIIPDYSAPCPAGWVKTAYGWMEANPEVVLIKKVNELVDIINNLNKQLAEKLNSITNLIK